MTSNPDITRMLLELVANRRAGGEDFVRKFLVWSLHWVCSPMLSRASGRNGERAGSARERPLLLP